jgi:GT2 family glycosyltransferase
MIPMMVVPTLTRHDLLGRMLDSVDVAVRHLVVIDNSGDGFKVGEGPWEDATVLRMPANLGVAGSWNLGVRLAHRQPWVLIASDDVLWPAGALERFVDVSGEERLVLSETWPHWCAFTLGMSVVKDVGLFDEGYYPAYFEDTDYERRCARAGVEVGRGPAVLHSNSSTLNTPDRNFAVSNERSFVSNRRLFEEDRHRGFDPYRWRANGWN